MSLIKWTFLRGHDVLTMIAVYIYKSLESKS